MLAVSTLLAALAAPNANMSSSAPVAIHSCSVSVSRAGPVAWVAFADAAPQTVSDVRIRVSSARGGAFDVIDRGTFSPAVEVAHTFRAPRGSEPASVRNASCSVSFARFADGTTWTR